MIFHQTSMILFHVNLQECKWEINCFQSILILMGVDVDRKQCNIPWNRGHHSKGWEEADLTKQDLGTLKKREFSVRWYYFSYAGDFDFEHEKWTRNSTWVKYLHFKISIYTSILYSVIIQKNMSETSTLGLGINPFMYVFEDMKKSEIGLYLQINARLFIWILIHIIP